MKQLKKKKGFTLVELIVVIAIIAILAAIAVPTTMHFVEKANISKETQQMNITDTVQGIFLDTINNPINLTLDAKTGAPTSFAQLFTEATEDSLPKDLGGLVINVKQTVASPADAAATKWEVSFTLYGAKYGSKKDGRLTTTLQKLYKADELFYDATTDNNIDAALKTFTKDTTYTYKMKFSGVSNDTLTAMGGCVTDVVKVAIK